MRYRIIDNINIDFLNTRVELGFWFKFKSFKICFKTSFKNQIKFKQL